MHVLNFVTRRRNFVQRSQLLTLNGQLSSNPHTLPLTSQPHLTVLTARLFLLILILSEVSRPDIEFCAFSKENECVKFDNHYFYF